MTTTDQLIKALCNTLVYSLWQGVILAAVAGIIVIATRKSTSAMRYNLLTGALGLFAIGAVVTFITQFKLVHFAAPALNIGNGAVLSPINLQPINGTVTTQSGNILATLSGYLDSYHNSIVCVWFLIICIKSIQFGVSLYGTYTLKSTNVFPPDSFWKERAMQLARLVGVTQAIDMLESGLAKVPMVIGHLKPVILIPVGMLTALSPQEIEAIILHELAHIKRRDYLVNMLQSLMEIVFFFNPAVLWISNLIKAERENCCDDIALAQNGNKSNYIHALVSCEEFQSAIPAYTMAFPGNKNTLLNRVKRMATNRNNSLNQFEKAFLAICLVMSGLCFSAFAAKDEIKKTVHEVVKVLQHENIYKEENQKVAEQTAQLQDETGKLKGETALVEASKPELKEDILPADTIKKRDSLHIAPKVAVTVNPQVSVNTVTTVAPVNVNTHVNVQPVLANLNVQLGTLKGHLSGLNDTLRHRQNTYNTTFKFIVRDLYKMKVLTDTNNVNLNLNEKELVVNGVKQPDDIHKTIFDKYGKGGAGYAYNNKYTNGYTSYSYSNGNSNNNSYTYTYDSNSGDGSSSAHASSSSRAGTAPTAPTPPTPPTSARRSHSRASSGDEDVNQINQELITQDMLKDKIITDANNINLKLTEKEFIVNGKRQSDEIFQKYKKKYIPADATGNWAWSYSHSN